MREHQVEWSRDVPDGHFAQLRGHEAGKGETGIYLHSDFRLAIFRDGKGMAFQLDPTIARELGQHLIRVADAAEAPPTNEAVN